MRVLCLAMLTVGLSAAQQWHQIRLFTGFNAFEGAGITDHPSVGAGYDVGLTRNLAVTSGYTWNLVETASLQRWALGHGILPDARLRVSGRASVHDLMGGLKIQAPIGRVSPFVSPLGGVAVTTDIRSFSVERWGIGGRGQGTVAKPAAGVGTGAEIRMGRGWSLLVEAKAIRPMDLGWYGHVGFGFTYRTKLRAAE